MTTDKEPPPHHKDLLPPCGLESLLPEGATITASTPWNQRWVLALDGAAPRLVWTGPPGTERQGPLMPFQSGPAPFQPFQSLLPGEKDLLAIAADRAGIYRRDEGAGTPDHVRTVRLPLESYQILAAARTECHLAILATRIGRTGVKSYAFWRELGHSPVTHYRRDLLLLLEAGSFRELGSAAREQRFDGVGGTPPPPRWGAIGLTETELQIEDAVAGTIRISLGKGQVEDLQGQVYSFR